MRAGLQEAVETEPAADTHTLFWVAVYLVQLEWGGPEEGGWWFEEAGLVTAPDIYVELGVMPACRHLMRKLSRPRCGPAFLPSTRDV